jgi:hypothetical protein
MTDLGRPRGSVTSAIASSAVATTAVLGLLVGLNFGFGESAGSASAAGQSAEQADLSDADLSDTDLTDTAAQPYGPQPADSAVPGGLPTIDKAPVKAAKPAVPAQRDSTAPDVAVVVLNQTVRRGLAAEFRSVLAEAGWQVGGVGNFRGNVPATTVYYPPGMKPQARALAAAFGQVDRIRPAFEGIPADKLTVILCKDYPRT